MMDDITKLRQLEIAFNNAFIEKSKYIGVSIITKGCPEHEVIINPKANFMEKLEYYKNAYNNDLELKAFKEIKIIRVAYGNSFEELESSLI